ncbi:MAG: DUF4278 domain-containing protein [Leptolyngbyaceae cyanobacterium SM2_5_2]|nr:DUF4278 domain-containing protein [Leptolyngbyaceae cyanobacterium SM2_5_2]
MQLSFLGQTYTASFPDLEVTGVHRMGTFRGQTYAIKQFHVANCPQPVEELSFMGRRYKR